VIATIVGALVVRLILRLREHELAEVGRREVAPDVDREGAPVKPVAVKLDEGPVARILVGSVGDDDGLDVEDGADDSLNRWSGFVLRLVTSL
jgi:hypothetical protein